MDFLSEVNKICAEGEVTKKLAKIINEILDIG